MKNKKGLSKKQNTVKKNEVERTIRNPKELTRTEEQKAVAQQLLAEVLSAYKKPRVRSVSEIEERLETYFEICVERSMIPVMEEMALYLGYTLPTLGVWLKSGNCPFGPRAVELIETARAFIQAFDAKMVTSGNLNFNTYSFRAKNFYGMRDQSEVTVTPGNPLGDVSSLEEAREKYAKSLPDIVVPDEAKEEDKAGQGEE